MAKAKVEFVGVGRRKTAVSAVKMTKGKGARHKAMRA